MNPLKRKFSEGDYFEDFESIDLDSKGKKNFKLVLLLYKNVENVEYIENIDKNIQNFIVSRKKFIQDRDEYILSIKDDNVYVLLNLLEDYCSLQKRFVIRNICPKLKFFPLTHLPFIKKFMYSCKCLDKHKEEFEIQSKIYQNSTLPGESNLDKLESCMLDNQKLRCQTILITNKIADKIDSMVKAIETLSSRLNYEIKRSTEFEEKYNMLINQIKFRDSEIDMKIESLQKETFRQNHLQKADIVLNNPELLTQPYVSKISLIQLAPIPN